MRGRSALILLLGGLTSGFQDSQLKLADDLTVRSMVVDSSGESLEEVGSGAGSHKKSHHQKKDSDRRMYHGLMLSEAAIRELSKSDRESESTINKPDCDKAQEEAMGLKEGEPGKEEESGEGEPGKADEGADTPKEGVEELVETESLEEEGEEPGKEGEPGAEGEPVDEDTAKKGEEMEEKRKTACEKHIGCKWTADNHEPVKDIDDPEFIPKVDSFCRDPKLMPLMPLEEVIDACGFVGSGIVKDNLNKHWRTINYDAGQKVEDDKMKEYPKGDKMTVEDASANGGGGPKGHYGYWVNHELDKDNFAPTKEGELTDDLTAKDTESSKKTAALFSDEGDGKDYTEMRQKCDKYFTRMNINKPGEIEHDLAQYPKGGHSFLAAEAAQMMKRLRDAHWDWHGLQTFTNDLNTGVVGAGGSLLSGMKFATHEGTDTNLELARENKEVDDGKQSNFIKALMHALLGTTCPGISGDKEITALWDGKNWPDALSHCLKKVTKGCKDGKCTEATPKETHESTDESLYNEQFDAGVFRKWVGRSDPDYEVSSGSDAEAPATADKGADKGAATEEGD